MARGGRSNNEKSNGATLGFKAILWATADKLRNKMDAAKYKHAVLGLIFLKCISDAFEERHAQLHKEVEQAQIPRSRTNTRQITYVGFPKRLAGPSGWLTPNRPICISWWRAP